MSVEMDVQFNEYKSPLRKLVAFFKKSRDQWKRKHQVRAVEESREHWRELALKHRQRIAELQNALAEQKNRAADGGQPTRC